MCVHLIRPSVSANTHRTQPIAGRRSLPKRRLRPADSGDRASDTCLEAPQRTSDHQGQAQGSTRRVPGCLDDGSEHPPGIRVHQKVSLPEAAVPAYRPEGPRDHLSSNPCPPGAMAPEVEPSFHLSSPNWDALSMAQRSAACLSWSCLLSA